MNVKIHRKDSVNARQWDNYVYSHPHSTVYHLSGWLKVICNTYKHDVYYLVAEKGYRITGILPIVHLKSLFLKSHLISIPFFDFAGILADNEKTERALIMKVIELGNKLKVDIIELRHIKSNLSFPNNEHYANDYSMQTMAHKVRMLLELPISSEVLMKSFKSKLRSQIKRPLKAGLYSKIGGIELLDDFYKVFTTNMRDLGSPVHSKTLMKNVLKEFPGTAGIVMVYKKKLPVACGLVAGFKDTLENPWASSLKQYSRLAPNMLLYWTMLEYACNKRYKYFDFGRSSPGEGTYKFKKQWGSVPILLNWHCISLNKEVTKTKFSYKAHFKKAIQYWQKLPVPVTKIIGPMIRKHIGL